MTRFRSLVLGVCSLSIICQPLAAVEAQTLPGEPAPPSASDMQHLSTEEGLQTAIDWAKFGQEPDTGKVVDVAIGVISVAYPPAGIALGIAKGLVMSGSPDPVGTALKVLDERINLLNQRLDNLERQVNALRDRGLKRENLERMRWLLDHRQELQALSNRLKKKPTDRNEKDNIAYEAQLLAARFLASNGPDSDLWQWSDMHVFTDRNTKKLTSRMLDPDFKPLPTFEYYVSVLVLWMSAIEYASDGNARYVTGNRALVAELLKHAKYLSVRPGWRGELNNSDPATTLPEQIMKRIHCYAKPVSRYPTNLTCNAIYVCDDAMRRTETGVGTVQFQMPANNMMCNLQVPVRREPSAQELEVRQASYRQNPVYGTAAMAEWQKWRVPLVVPDEEKMERAYGIEAMTVLADQLVRLAKFGSIRENYEGAFDPTTATYDLLYAVKPEGDLLWYMHRMGTRPKGFQAPGDSSSRLDASTTANVSRITGGRSSTSTNAAGTSSPQGPAEGRRTLGKRRLGPTPRDPGTEVQHAWDGPKRVGEGWQSFRDVIPAGGSGIYAITNDGKLLWYRHDGFLNGTPDLTRAKVVGEGWNRFVKVVSGGEGVLYGIESDGTLKWYKHNGYLDGSMNWEGPVIVGTGWAQFKHVFSGGEGVLYAIAPDGKLFWYKHKAYLNALPMVTSSSSSGPRMVAQAQMLAWARSWEDVNARLIAAGWGQFKNAFSSGDGNLYAIKSTGEVLWYKHEGFKDGSVRWHSPVEIAADWNDFLFVIPRISGSSNSQQIVR